MSTMALERVSIMYVFAFTIIITGPKTASISELSRGAVNPVICKVQCDFSLPAMRQI